jgi:hypothetical protein
LNALNSVADLTATYTSDGVLQLSTSNAQSLTIGEVANGLLDVSKSPLANLGLTAGTTAATVTGYRQVEVGTEQVVVGTEQIKIGTEEVEVGTEHVKVGTEQYVSGTELVTIGSERVKIGERNTVVGTERVKVGTQLALDDYERQLVGLEKPTEATLEAVERTSMQASAVAGYVELLFSLIPLEETKHQALVPLEFSRSAYFAWDRDRPDGVANRK